MAIQSIIADKQNKSNMRLCVAALQSLIIRDMATNIIAIWKAFFDEIVYCRISKGESSPFYRH